MWVEKHGPTWRIRDVIGGKKVTLQSGYATKTAAKDGMRLAQSDKLRGEQLVPRGGRLLLADWVDAWLPSYEVSLKPSAAHSEPSRIRNHILPLLGQYELDEVDTLTVQRWVANLLAGRGPGRDGRPRKPLAVKTVHNCHGILFGIMQAAVRQRLIRSNPCADTQLPKRVHKEMRFLTEPETGRLLAALPPHWRPLVLLLIATGLRWGEAVGLQVGQVEVLAKVPSLRVIRALHELSGSARIVFTEPKTARSRRTVTFTKQVADVLLALVAGKDREDLVFRAPRGGPARTRNFRRVWLKSTAAAGLAGLRIHDLRHSHAAALISAGVPLTAIQHRLGHSSIAVTSDLYGHLLPQVDDNILTAVAAALASIDPGVLSAELDDELATL
jgi:integrase